VCIGVYVCVCIRVFWECVSVVCEVCVGNGVCMVCVCVCVYVCVYVCVGNGVLHQYLHCHKTPRGFRCPFSSEDGPGNEANKMKCYLSLKS